MIDSEREVRRGIEADIRKHVEELEAERETLIDLIDDLCDEEDCEYDHNDFCQTHYYQRPCAHERARAVLADADGGAD